jgi:hypothetical protein
MSEDRPSVSLLFQILFMAVFLASFCIVSGLLVVLVVLGVCLLGAVFLLWYVTLWAWLHLVWTFISATVSF